MKYNSKNIFINNTKYIYIGYKVYAKGIRIKVYRNIERRHQFIFHFNDNKSGDFFQYIVWGKQINIF